MNPDAEPQPPDSAEARRARHTVLLLVLLTSLMISVPLLLLLARVLR
jgi:hypothetical protein